jgi:hypothetical protein
VARVSEKQSEENLFARDQIISADSLGYDDKLSIIG